MAAKWFNSLDTNSNQACRPGGAGGTMHKRDRTEPASESESLYSYTRDSNPAGSLHILKKITLIEGRGLFEILLQNNQLSTYLIKVHIF